MPNRRGETWHGHTVRLHLNDGLWGRLTADAKARKVWSLDEYLSQVVELWAVGLAEATSCAETVAGTD